MRPCAVAAAAATVYWFGPLLVLPPRMAPGGGVWISQPAQNPGREGGQQDARDAVPEAHPVALGGIVQQRGGQELGIVLPAGQQPSRDVQAVATIGDRHAAEQRMGARGQHAARERLLLRLDARPQVGHELRDPMHRSGPR